MNNRISILIAAATVALVSVILFSSSKTYPPITTASTNSIVTNSYVLEETVPEQVYTYVLKKIQRYANAQSLGTRLVIERDLIKLDDTSYNFTLLGANKKITPISVVVVVKNYGNFFSITVYINDELQDIN